ncbi:terminase small subunit [uncultured Acetobacteroides sp.]|uniref:terminase small subunit n=1 Tax=uncultured Acetobacteroides sp. TaxID=1760811 RepID=UPI0029F4C8FD|nr:terminase small subunit [uncultured Acetobacteroides sp.]
MKKTALSPKQRRFCEEYLIDLNATQAAIRAGYSERTAGSIGQENLKKPEIKTFIKNLREEVRERNRIKLDELIQTLAAIVRLDPVDLFNDNGTIKNLSDMPEAARKCITELKLMEISSVDGPIGMMKTIKLTSKLEAIEKLMKHLGGYEKDNEQRKPEIGTVVVLPYNERNN